MKRIITNQEQVYLEIFAQKLLPKIVDISPDEYPKEDLKVILIEIEHPLEKPIQFNEIDANIVKVIIDISVDAGKDQNYILNEIDKISKEFPKDTKILFTVSENEKTPNQLKIFIVTDETIDNTGFSWKIFEDLNKN